MPAKGDHSVFKDCIQDNIRLICDRLDLQGDHCLFMRASDDGVMATGSKKGELFLDQQPEICQQFRAFCSDEVLVVVSTDDDLGVTSRDGGQTNQEHSGSGWEIDRNDRKTRNVKRSTEKDCQGTRNERTASNDIRKAGENDRTVNTCMDLVEEMKTSSRPKRAMCMPIKLRGFETCLKKDTDSPGKRTHSNLKGKDKSKQGNTTTAKKLGVNKLGERSTEGRLSKTSKRKPHAEESPDQHVKGQVLKGSGRRQQSKRFKGIEKTRKQKTVNASDKVKCRMGKNKEVISNTLKRSTAQSKRSEREDDEVNGTYEEEFVEDDNDEDYEAGQSSENEADSETYSPFTRGLCVKNVKIKKNWRNFKCDKCDAMFVLQRNCKRHMENNVCDTVIAKRRKLDNADKRSEGVIKSGEAIVKVSTLPGETTVKEEQENSTVGDNSVKHRRMRRREHVKDRYKCDNCGFVLSSQVSLRRHHVKNGCAGIKLKLQTNVTDKQDSYKCDFCDRPPFTSLFLYQKHVLRHQIVSSTKSCQFQCTLCKKKYLYDRERVAHMFQMHKKRRPVNCQVCGHSFMSLNDHRKHRKYCTTTGKCEGASTGPCQQPTHGEGQGDATVKVESTVDYQEEATSKCRGKTIDDSSQTHEDSLLSLASIPGDKSQITQNGYSDIEEKVKLSDGTTIMVDASKIYISFVVDSDGNSGKPRSGKSVPSSDLEISDDNVDQVAMSEIEQNCEPDTVPLVCKTCDKDICSLFVGDSVDSTCQVCHRLFPNSYQLNKHKAIHSASQFYQCHICDKCFVEPKNLHRHLHVIHKLWYTVCRHCCGLCISRKGLLRHMKEKHPSQFKIACRVCGEQFADRSQCLEHEEKEHQLVTDKIEKGCICDQCGKVLMFKSSLKAHIDWHNNVRPYECPHCKQRYRTKMQLRRHIPIHSSVKKHQCEVCGECFTLKETLRRHVRVHDDIKRYKCQDCDMKFRSTDGLNNHIVRNHVGVVDIGKLNFKVRQCDICGILSASKQMYNQHMNRNHMTSRPYKCRLCALQFGSRSNLLEHIRKIHQQHGVHTCLICNQKALNPSKWKRHISTKKHVELCEQSGIDPEGLEQGTHYIIGGSDALAKETNVEHLMEWIGEGDESEYIDRMDRKANCVPTTEHETHRGKWQRKQTRTNASVRKQASAKEGTKPPIEDVGFLEEVTETVESVTVGQQNIQIIIDTHVDDGSRPVQIVEAQEAVDSMLQMDDLVQGQNNTIDDTTVHSIVYYMS